MREIRETFGWMVLHNLNIHAKSDGHKDGEDNMLPEVQEKDDLNVLSSLGVGMDDHSQWRRAKQRPGDGPSVAYPLGTHPTWGELVKVIQERPWEVMSAWRFDPVWASSAIAGGLFIQFTLQMWLLLDP